MLNKRGFLKNKKGDEIITPIIIFLVLNVAFVAILMTFVYNSSTGALVYEQAAAKQIVMAIDSAQPPFPMRITIDMEDVLELAKKNNVEQDSMIRVDNINNQVIINLGRSRGGYSMNFFSDYDINSYWNGDNYEITINPAKT